MATSQLISITKPKGNDILLKALKHNKRELQNEWGSGRKINPNKSYLNYSLTGDSDATKIDRYAKSLMALAGINKPRKNGVMLVEVLISLPVDRHQQDTKQFFIDTFNWIKEAFEGELLSFDVHLDESAPHAHALILPLINGKMNGSDLVGGKGKLSSKIKSFHHNVARHYGLSNKAKLKLSEQDRVNLIKNILRTLENDPVKDSKIWHIIDADIRNNPLLYSEALSINTKKEASTATKHFVDIMRSKGKGSFEK